ncbi:hypothetical protein [Jatrophihabitans endophyticus]|uniref:hypothetical protein n=1 Tax=Jatrophihabitans endophyticus TaxID=1206085 RepID=UPI0019EBA0AF|nr:hypothetical protein [Jatrophihabitans endophyticus]MBE7188125.1 hypothetical protein [Jatrophihabitans endophyticus]
MNAGVGGEPSGTGRRGRVEVVVLAVLVALAAAFFVWRVVDNAPPALHPLDDTYGATQARVGRTYVSIDPDEDTAVRYATVRLPFGTEHVRTAVPATRGVQTADDNDVVAPADGSFVSVELTLDTSTSTVPVDLLGGDTDEVTSTVVTGGRRYPLGRRADLGTQADVVAVAGHPSAPTVEITYDGVSQRVDMGTGKVSPGASAAPLYHRVPAGTQSCGPATLPAGYTQTAATYPLDCTLAWRRLPYAPGRGWARPGSGWVLFSVTTLGPGAVVHHGRTEPVFSGQGLLTVTCDGSPAADLDHEADYRNRDGVSVFTCPQTSSGRISIAEKLESDTGSPLVARWSTRVP